jgi:hypothetical protein
MKKEHQLVRKERLLFGGDIGRIEVKHGTQSLTRDLMVSFLGIASRERNKMRERQLAARFHRRRSPNRRTVRGTRDGSAKTDRLGA